MWRSWVKTKDTTQVMYTAKLKDGPKRAINFFKLFWKGFLKWYDGGEENWSYKMDCEIAMFLSSQNIDFPFLFEETLGDFLFLSVFLNTFSVLFSMLRLFEDSGILMIFEEKNSLQKFFSNGIG
jgi:hypothetical protein